MIGYNDRRRGAASTHTHSAAPNQPDNEKKKIEDALAQRTRRVRKEREGAMPRRAAPTNHHEETKITKKNPQPRRKPGAHP
jgi:hypothetical protein